MKIITAMPGTPVEIGRTGENHAIKVLFQNILPGWKETYGEGLVSMVYKRPKDKHAYPVVCLVENDGADISWIVNRTDLENSGLGKLELIYTVNDTVAISETYPVIVKRSISGEAGSEPPEDPGKTWFENINDKITNLEKREMIVIFTRGKNSKIHADHSYEEIREACLNQNTLVTGLLYQNGSYISLPVVSYQKLKNQIVFTGAIVNTASATDTDGWYWLKIIPDETVGISVKFYEMGFNKDSSTIRDPNSKDHYPSTKVMVDYVNSQILAGKEIFVVNWEQSPEVCQADKTYAEIKAALENDVVTVVGKTKDGGETYATHEITIATDGKIYFRFIWYDETRGTMEKYFWLREDEYGSSVPPKPVDNVLAVKFNLDDLNNITADHTYEEIKTAYVTGKYVYGYADTEGTSARFSLQIEPTFLMHNNKFLFALDIQDFETGVTIKNTFIEVSEAGITLFNEFYFTKFLQLKTDDMTQKVEAGIEFNTGDLYIKPINGNKDLGITGAQAGQIAKITAVDDTGKPTAWEPVDLPSGGKTWEKIGEWTVPEGSQSIVFTQKIENLNTYQQIKAIVVFPAHTPDTDKTRVGFLFGKGYHFFTYRVGVNATYPTVTLIDLFICDNSIEYVISANNIMNSGPMYGTNLSDLYPLRKGLIEFSAASPSALSGIFVDFNNPREGYLDGTSIRVYGVRA